MSLSKTFKEFLNKSLHSEDVVYKYVDLYSRLDTRTLTYLPLSQERLTYLFFHNITTTTKEEDNCTRWGEVDCGSCSCKVTTGEAAVEQKGGRCAAVSGQHVQLANTAERYYCRESVTSDCERPAYIDYHFYRPVCGWGILNTHTQMFAESMHFFVHNTPQCVRRRTTTWTGFQRCATQLQCGNSLGWSWMIEAKPQMCRGRKIEFARTNEKFLKLLLSYTVCSVLRYINVFLH